MASSLVVGKQEALGDHAGAFAHGKPHPAKGEQDDEITPVLSLASGFSPGKLWLHLYWGRQNLQPSGFLVLRNLRE